METDVRSLGSLSGIEAPTEEPMIREDVVREMLARGAAMGGPRHGAVRDRSREQARVDFGQLPVWLGDVETSAHLFVFTLRRPRCSAAASARSCGLPTTAEDIAALDRLRSGRRLTFDQYLEGLAALEVPSPARLRSRPRPTGGDAPFELIR
jgi:hypothetical protein